MIQLGDLRTRLVLQAPMETPDDQGGFTRDYQDVSVLWARLESMRAQGGVEADGQGATITHRMTLRGGVTFTTAHRFRLAARIFRIVAYRDIEDGRFIEVDAQERIA